MTLSRIIWCCLIFNAVLFMVGTSRGEMEMRSLLKIQVAKERDICKVAVKECRENILELNQDILRLRADREWLMVKILEIREQGCRVPPELLKSQGALSWKIKTREADLKKLNAYFRKFMKRLQVVGAVGASHDHEANTDGCVPENFDPCLFKAEGAICGNKAHEAGTLEKKGSDLAHEIREKVVAAGLNDWVELVSEDSEVRMEVRLPILFASGKSRVAAGYKKFFNQLSGFLNLYPVAVTVEGFSDGNGPGEGDHIAAIELGADRAVNVAGELIKAGMAPSLFTIISRSPDNQAQETLSASSPMKRKVQLVVFFNQAY